jgi:hypothetical protein
MKTPYATVAHRHALTTSFSLMEVFMKMLGVLVFGGITLWGAIAYAQNICVVGCWEGWAVLYEESNYESCHFAEFMSCRRFCTTPQAGDGPGCSVSSAIDPVKDDCCMIPQMAEPLIEDNIAYALIEGACYPLCNTVEASCKCWHAYDWAEESQVAAAFFSSACYQDPPDPNESNSTGCW